MRDVLGFFHAQINRILSSTGRLFSLNRLAVRADMG